MPNASGGLTVAIIWVMYPDPQFGHAQRRHASGRSEPWEVALGVLRTACLPYVPVYIDKNVDVVRPLARGVCSSGWSKLLILRTSMSALKCFLQSGCSSTPEYGVLLHVPRVNW